MCLGRCAENQNGNSRSHVLVHFVKSACLYSVNPFSTFFSANNQHNFPILFLYVPDLLTSRTGISFFLSGKVTFSATYLKANELFSQIYSPKLSNEISWYHDSFMLDPLCDWLPELYRLQPQLYFIQLQHQFQLLLLCSDTGKNFNRKLF